MVLTLHGSAADVGWLNAARWLPYLVVGLVVGAVVDGRRRLPLMVSTDLVQAVLLLAIPVLWWIGLLSMPTLLLVVLAYGTASVVNVAAAMSLLPRLVEPQQLQPAHARIDGADAVSMTVGPAVGGLVVAAVGAPLAVLVDSLTYVHSALTLRRLDLDEPPPRTGVTATGLLREVVEGIRWAYRGSGLSTLAFFTHAWFVGHAIMGVVLAPYILGVLDLTAFQFGIIGAAGGVGAVLGATVTTRVGRRLGTGRTIVACHVVTTLGVTVMVFAGHGMGPAGTVAVLAVGQGLYGLAMGMSNSHEMSYRQLVNAGRAAGPHKHHAAFAQPCGHRGGRAACRDRRRCWGVRPTMVLAAVIFALVAAGLGGTSFRDVRAPA